MDGLGEVDDLKTPDDHAPIEITQSGTLENPTTITSYGGEVFLDGGESPTGVLIKAHGSVDNILISNLTIRGVVWMHGYGSQGYIHNFVIENCELFGGGDLMNGYRFGSVLFVLGVYDSAIRNNILHDNHDSINDRKNDPVLMEYDAWNLVIENNEIYNGEGPGIRLKDDPNNVTIRYNHVYDCPHYAGIMVGGQVHHGADDNKAYQNIIENSENGIWYEGETDGFQFFNNLLVQNNQCIRFYAVSGVDEGNYADHNFSAWNNICYNSTVYNVDTRWAPGGAASFNYLDHNLYYLNDVWYDRNWQTGSDPYTAGSLNDWQAYSGFDQGSLDADPQFVSSSDYCLQPGSPARTAGIDLQDADGDGNVTEPLTIGAYITGDETIGLLDEEIEYHPADTDEDGVIGKSEIRVYVALWKDGGVSLPGLFSGLGEWKIAWH